ncbi:hypothetical protein K3495_g180 [Podosphaera aphanis]|nr:hypothetical protein K3495_g180 [Podosphaera aphanis]
MSEQHLSVEVNANDLTFAFSIAQELIQPKVFRRKSQSGAFPANQCPKSVGMDSFHQKMEFSSPSSKLRSLRALHSNQTCSESSQDMVIKLAELADESDRTTFMEEYNNIVFVLLYLLHLKNQQWAPCIRLTNNIKAFLQDDFRNTFSKTENWFSRNILRRQSSAQSFKHKSERKLSHKRSLSDLSLRLNAKKDKLKDKDLHELARLCGVSLLYLPSDFAAENLNVPTCFRALAQYLVDHGTTTKGLFRIPGSHTTINELYNYYCCNYGHRETVSGTVRCPTLPDHIKYDVYDVASTLKKFLAGLPGGILGSLTIFNAFISIKIQMDEDPERNESKHRLDRARMIALAIMSISSRYRRDLIAAVFGLLSIVGHAAEITRRDNEWQNPSSDLMGYNSLGIIFGPILVGNLLQDHKMQLAISSADLVLLPLSPPKSKKEQRKARKANSGVTSFNVHVDKIKIANSVTEMLITYWRDVVYQFINLQNPKESKSIPNLALNRNNRAVLRSSKSEYFDLRKPADWEQQKLINNGNENVFPTPIRSSQNTRQTKAISMIAVKKRPISTHLTRETKLLNILSPMTQYYSETIYHNFIPEISPQTYKYVSPLSYYFKSYSINSSIKSHRTESKVAFKYFRQKNQENQLRNCINRPVPDEKFHKLKADLFNYKNTSVICDRDLGTTLISQRLEAISAKFQLFESYSQGLKNSQQILIVLHRKSTLSSLALPLYSIKKTSKVSCLDIKIKTKFKANQHLDSWKLIRSLSDMPEFITSLPLNSKLLTEEYQSSGSASRRIKGYDVMKEIGLLVKFDYNKSIIPISPQLNSSLKISPRGAYRDEFQQRVTLFTKDILLALDLTESQILSNSNNSTGSSKNLDTFFTRNQVDRNQNITKKKLLKVSKSDFMSIEQQNESNSLQLKCGLKYYHDGCNGTKLQPNSYKNYIWHSSTDKLRGSFYPEQTYREPLFFSTSTRDETKPVLGISNSLFKQVILLQQQLNMKNDEIQKLRQQLDTREHIEIVSLYGQLQESKNLARFWKERAKYFEEKALLRNSWF